MSVPGLTGRPIAETSGGGCESQTAQTPASLLGAEVFRRGATAAHRKCSLTGLVRWPPTLIFTTTLLLLALIRYHFVKSHNVLFSVVCVVLFFHQPLTNCPIAKAKNPDTPRLSVKCAGDHTLRAIRMTMARTSHRPQYRELGKVHQRFLDRFRLVYVRVPSCSNSGQFRVSLMFLVKLSFPCNFAKIDAFISISGMYHSEYPRPLFFF